MKFIYTLVFTVFVSNIVFAAAVTLQERKDMRFANISADPAGDTITLDTNGNLSAANTSLFSGSARAAEFRARGDKNTAVTISFSSGDFLSGIGANMPLGNFTHDAGPTPTIGGNKQLNFKVGADLTINAIQLGGNYSGTYSVFVDYQ